MESAAGYLRDDFTRFVDGLEFLPELAPFIPDFELLIDDLCAVDDDALQQRPLAPFPKITLWLLRDGRSIDALIEHLATWGAELEELVRADPERHDARASWVERVILALARSSPIECHFFDRRRRRTAKINDATVAALIATPE